MQKSVRKLRVVRGGGRRLSISALTFAALAIALPGGPAEAQKTPGKILIGTLFEVSGAAASLGGASSAGVRLAVKEINEKGGILGRQVEIVPGDNQTDPTASVNEATRLALQKDVDAVVGPSISQLALAAMPVLTKARIPQVTTAGSQELTPELAPYHFSLLADANSNANALVDHAVDALKVHSAAILVDNGGQSKSAAVALRKRAAERNLPITGEQVYEYRTTDMTPQMLALKRGNPELIFVFASSLEDVTATLKAMQDLNFKPRIAGNGSFGGFADVVARRLGSQVFDGVTGENAAGFTYCSSDPVGQSEYAKFLVRLKAFSPDYDKLPHTTSAYYYDMVYVLKAGIEGAGSADGPKVAAWLEQNAGSVKLVTIPPSASRTTHFLGAAPNAIAQVEHPEKLREDGLQKRAGC